MAWGGFILSRVISGNYQSMLTGQTAFDSPRGQLFFESLKIQKQCQTGAVVVAVVGGGDQNKRFSLVDL